MWQNRPPAAGSPPVARAHQSPHPPGSPGGGSPARWVLLGLAMLTMLAALWGGLTRMGWALGAPAVLPSLHGPVMALGFLGTVIGLERAVALRTPWAYATPVLAAAGALTALAGLPLPVSQGLLTLAGCGLVVVFIRIYRLQPATHTAVMTLAAALWATGAGLWWAGLPTYRAVPWWAGYLVLTIAGERLELSRLVRPSPRARQTFALAVGVFVLGLLLALWQPQLGTRVMGVGLVAQAIWLARHDVARRTVRLPGLTRFIASCLLAGYVWLGIAGIFWLAFGPLPAGPRYDAMLHAIFLGYVFSMIFGHAPVILPAVTGLALSFQPAIYGPLVLLHLSLALRVGGDLAGSSSAARWGGLLNALAILGYFALTARGILAARKGGQPGSWSGQPRPALDRRPTRP